jgi:predicted nucleic acid-binding protein
MPSKPLVYWDTCVFLGYLQQTKGRYADLSKILAEAENNRILLCTSAITITEAAFIDRNANTSPEEIEQQGKIIKDFFRRDCVNIVWADQLVAQEAADILRRYKGLTPLDAIQVATALFANVPCLYTYDGANKAGKRRSGKLLTFDGKIRLPGKGPLSIKTPEKFFDSSSRPLIDHLAD